MRYVRFNFSIDNVCFGPVFYITYLKLKGRVVGKELSKYQGTYYP